MINTEEEVPAKRKYLIVGLFKKSLYDILDNNNYICFY